MDDYDTGYDTGYADGLAFHGAHDDEGPDPVDREIRRRLEELGLAPNATRGYVHGFKDGYLGY